MAMSAPLAFTLSRLQIDPLGRAGARRIEYLNIRLNCLFILQDYN